MPNGKTPRRESARRQAYGRLPIVPICAAAIILATGLLAGFSMLTARDQVADSRAAARSAGLAALYADARLLVRQRELLEIDYRLDPHAETLTQRRAAAESLRVGFARIAVADGSPATRIALRALALANDRYTKASDELFRALGRGDIVLADRLDRVNVDPAYRTLDRLIARASDTASVQSIRQANLMRNLAEESQWQIALAFAASLVVIALFVSILVSLRRRLAATLRDQIEKLSDVAFRDALTGLRNRRSFREDLERSVAQLDRGGAQFSLCMLDLDGLKTVNDTLGHPTGDQHIRAFADALSQTVRASDSAYRIGGDEFAIVLHDERAPGALELIGRLNDTLAHIDGAVRVSAGAGIVEAKRARSTEELVCEADIALLAAKRTNQPAVVYDPKTSDLTLDARKTHADTATLSNALALAVDAKDPYTRSHSQVVSRLCGLVAETLGFDDEHVAQMRLAGLLHDVGKIGVPDALLAKPGTLTDSEQAEMRRHAAVGGGIVAAAGLAEESDWVRHHHERYDGTGFPDGLRGDAIPLASRIILACDAYEAMTSNRPYRKTPGPITALAELRRGSGTQFDPKVVEAITRVLAKNTIDPETPRHPYPKAA